jgi:NAD(P)-dependent dehydrogenase (short-subunit alcohol dehydrogenase family)
MQTLTVMITGASSGIGAALAREFAERGARLVLVARRTERLVALASELRAGGSEVLVCAGDVTRDGDLERATEQAQKTFGVLDVVVANAGFGVQGRLTRLSLDDVRRQFETNVFGVLRTFLRHPRRPGRVARPPRPHRQRLWLLLLPGDHSLLDEQVRRPRARRGTAVRACPRGHLGHPHRPRLCRVRDLAG